MVSRLKRIVLILSGGALAACSTFDFSGMIAASSSVEQRFEDSRASAASGFYPPTVTIDVEDYRFAVATDMHIKPEQWDRVGAFFRQVAAEGCSVVLLLGDYLHTAGESLARLADSIRAQETIRVFPTIGNHEVYQDGYDKSYRTVFGPTCYAFRVETSGGVDLFIALDSANGTLGRSQFDWFERLLVEQRADCRHCFVFTHANFFGPPQNVDLVSTFVPQEQMKLMHLLATHNVTAVFSGHAHHHDETTVRGVHYKSLFPWLSGRYCRIDCRADGECTYAFD